MTEQNILVGNSQTLIDINEDKNEFEATVVMRSERPVLFTIVDQTYLDNNPEPQFEVGTNMNRSFQIKNKPFQNYYLVLRSSDGSPVKVNVKVHLTDLNDTNVTPISSLNEDRTRQQLVERRMAMDQNDIEDNLYYPNSGNNMVLYIFLILIFVLVVVYVLKKC